MAKDNNFSFIREKISVLRTAVMYSMCTSPVKLPNDIVTFVSTDDEGHLWFLSHMPDQLLRECEQVFPVRLHFFRKGYDCHVEVSGKATIISNLSNQEFSSVINAEDKKAVLIKMTMSNVEYTEPHAKPKTPLQMMVERSYKWMLKLLAVNQTSVTNFPQSN